jgi:threonine/homoserine/homoserine lactone efflux protein
MPPPAVNSRPTRPRVLTWMRRTFAAAFVALGAKLALAER